MTRYHFIAAEKALRVWPVVVMCRVLGVSTSAFYAWVASPVRGGSDDQLLRVHIRAIHRQSRETYGSPRILAELREQGFRVSRKRVARLMREEGVAGLPAKRAFRVATTDSDHENPIADNVLQRNFEAQRPNEAWVGDITYLRTAAGFVYLAVLIDLHSRRVVGWAVRDHMRTSLVQEALQRAVALRNPPPGLVHHTDRGSQYASAAYRQDLQRIEAVPSMSRKGDCWDTPSRSPSSAPSSKSSRDVAPTGRTLRPLTRRSSTTSSASTTRPDGTGRWASSAPLRSRHTGHSLRCRRLHDSVPAHPHKRSQQPWPSAGLPLSRP